jgi:hypothetical protein
MAELLKKQPKGKNMKKLMIGMIVALVAVSVLGWPYGNVGLNVDEPEAQLDVGGDVIVRSNLTVLAQTSDAPTLLLGDSLNPVFPRIGLWADPDASYMYLSMTEDSTLTYNDKPIMDANGQFRSSPTEIWVNMHNGLCFIDGDNTKTAFVGIVTTPVTGVVFTVNGVSWTNLLTP